MVRLGAPLVLIGGRAKVIPERNTRTLAARRKRHILAKRGTEGAHAYDPTMNSPTWIDSIGVPNEYKLADQIASGFESMFTWITPNKNVDRINYVYYNVLRLSNLTRDAMEGLAEQLGPTSLMAVQNKMALDMLLAEKGACVPCLVTSVVLYPSSISETVTSFKLHHYSFHSRRLFVSGVC